jgi:hypothetical protein
MPRLSHMGWPTCHAWRAWRDAHALHGVHAASSCTERSPHTAPARHACRRCERRATLSVMLLCVPTCHRSLDTASLPVPYILCVRACAGCVRPDDFTRVPSPWARRIPHAAMLPANCSLAGPFVGGDGCERWWSRTLAQPYLPPVSRALLESQVVRAQGWPLGGARLPAEPCRGATKSAVARGAVLPIGVCRAVVAVRTAGAPLRRWVGWQLGGDDGAGFVDGPMLMIAAAVAAACALRLLLAGCTAALHSAVCSRSNARVRAAAQRSSRSKSE